MLAEYQGKIFNVEEMGEEVCLWKYSYVSGFEEKKTRRGTRYFEKRVSKELISPLFSVVFYGVTAKRKYVIQSVSDNMVDFICDDVEYAKANGFFEVERGICLGRKSINEFDEFFMLKKEEDSGKKQTILMDASEVVNAWNKYVTEVTI